MWGRKGSIVNRGIEIAAKIWFSAVIENKHFLKKATRAYSIIHSVLGAFLELQWKMNVIVFPRWICCGPSLCNWFNWSFRSKQLIDRSLTLANSVSSNSEMYVWLPLFKFSLLSRFGSFDLIWFDFFICLNVIHFLYWWILLKSILQMNADKSPFQRTYAAQVHPLTFLFPA